MLFVLFAYENAKKENENNLHKERGAPFVGARYI